VWISAFSYFYSRWFGAGRCETGQCWIMKLLLTGGALIHWWLSTVFIEHDAWCVNSVHIWEGRKYVFDNILCTDTTDENNGYTESCILVDRHLPTHESLTRLEYLMDLWKQSFMS
jgi:hypothetical protein